MTKISWNVLCSLLFHGILHMRKQWIPGPSFFFPAQSAPRASLRAKNEGLGTRLMLKVIANNYVQVTPHPQVCINLHLVTMLILMDVALLPLNVLFWVSLTSLTQLASQSHNNYYIYVVPLRIVKPVSMCIHISCIRVLYHDDASLSGKLLASNISSKSVHV